MREKLGGVCIRVGFSFKHKCFWEWKNKTNNVTTVLVREFPWLNPHKTVHNIDNLLQE